MNSRSFKHAALLSLIDAECGPGSCLITPQKDDQHRLSPQNALVRVDTVQASEGKQFKHLHLKNKASRLHES